MLYQKMKKYTYKENNMLYRKKDNSQAINLELVTGVNKYTLINQSKGGEVDSYRIHFFYKVRNNK